MRRGQMIALRDTLEQFRLGMETTLAADLGPEPVYDNLKFEALVDRISAQLRACEEPDEPRILAIGDAEAQILVDPNLPKGSAEWRDQTGKKLGTAAIL